MNAPSNPRYEDDFSVPEWRDLSDPASWGTPGAVFYNEDSGPEPKVVGDVGYSALLVMALVWVAYEYANKRLS